MASNPEKSPPRRSKAGPDIGSLLHSIERSVHEAVDLAVSAQQQAAGRASGRVDGSGSSRSSQSVRHDIKSILRSSAEAVSGILTTSGLTNEESESARDLLGHIKTLLQEVDTPSASISNLSRHKKPVRSSSRSKALHEDITDAEADREESSPSLTSGRRAAVDRDRDSGSSKDASDTEDTSSLPRSARRAGSYRTERSEVKQEEEAPIAKPFSSVSRRATSAKPEPSAGRYLDHNIVAVSPPPHLRSTPEVAPRRATSAVRRTSSTQQPEPDKVAHSVDARADRLESLLRRTEEVLERQLIADAPHAHGGAAPTIPTVGRANLFRSDAFDRQAYLRTGSHSEEWKHHGILRTGAPAPSPVRVERSQGGSEHAHTDTQGGGLSVDQLSQSANARGATSGFVTSAGPHAGASSAEVIALNASALVAGSDAVEVARLRGELAVIRQRITAAQLEAEHSRSSRDEAERQLQEEKALRSTSQDELSNTMQRVGSLSEQLSSAQERIISLQRQLTNAHADIEAATAAARQREHEMANKAQDDISTEVRMEREAQEQLRHRAVEVAIEEGRANVEAVEGRLQAEQTAHAAANSKIAALERQLEEARAEYTTSRSAFEDTQNSLVRVRTEIVSLTARIASLHTSVASKEDEIHALKERNETLQQQLEDNTEHFDQVIAGLQQRMEEHIEKMEELEGRAVQAEGRADESETLNKQQKATCERLRVDLEEVRGQLRVSQNTCNQLKDEARRFSIDGDARVAALEGKILALRDELDSSQRTERVLRETVIETQTALHVSTSRRETVEGRVQELEELLAQEQDAREVDARTWREQQDRAHSSVMELQEASAALQRELTSVRDAHASEVSKLQSTIHMLQAQVSYLTTASPLLSSLLPSPLLTSQFAITFTPCRWNKTVRLLRQSPVPSVWRSLNPVRLNMSCINN
jgi:predicted  nucleic acid-binding Zn-ribbon protein